jgi:acetyl-CoA synthetase
MSRLTDFTRYADAQRHFSREKLWDLFDGDAGEFNIAHECVDRHAGSGRDALVVVHADGDDEVIGYAALAVASSRFAHWLVANGVVPGERVAIMLEPSLAFYAAIFGTIKAGAIAVPLFTLFGPDGLALRIDDCAPAMLVTNAGKAATMQPTGATRVVVFDAALWAEMEAFPGTFAVATRADDLAAFQYTSGTTRALPEAVRHSHRTLVTLMVAALYGTGLRPGDRFMCPSSPAWGHGLWHGTFAPLALGLTVGAYAGRFDAARLLAALETHRFNNLSAAATHYRMMRNSGRGAAHRYALEKLSFTGEPIDPDTAAFVRDTFGHEACSMYGTTEMGVVLVNYPGADDFPVKSGSLGKPPPGLHLEVQDAHGMRLPAGTTGHLMVRRRGDWLPTRDLAREDADGYFHHAGRADDVIISAGWTMSAVELENAILGHPDVSDAGVIAVADALRGQVAKAFVVSARAGGDAFAAEIQDLVKSRLSLHEYPRVVAFVAALPKTPAGKLNRRQLRDSEQTAPPLHAPDKANP